MAPRQTLVAVSAVQLAAGLAGQVIALRRRRNYDIGFMRGSPDHVARDSLWAGTAYSAPAHMLTAQAWGTARLRRGPEDGARRVLGMLGVVMVPGYLMERSARANLRPGGFDPVATPLVVVALVGAAAMGVLGHRDQAGR
jgi:hypothetical protein